MILLHADTPIYFAGSDAPAAFAEVASIGHIGASALQPTVNSCNVADAAKCSDMHARTTPEALLHPVSESHIDPENNVLQVARKMRALQQTLQPSSLSTWKFQRTDSTSSEQPVLCHQALSACQSVQQHLSEVQQATH